MLNNDQQPVTILFQGSASSGKSQLICWHTLGKANAETTPTLEEEHEVFEDVRGRKVQACLLDTAGRKKYGDMIAEWVDRANAQILVLNLEDAASINYLKSHQAELAKPEIRARVLVGNSPSGKQENRVISRAEAMKLANSLFGEAMPYVETNTRTGEGVPVVFTTLMDRLFPQQRSGAEVVPTKVVEEEEKMVVHAPSRRSSVDMEKLLADRETEISQLKARQVELEARLEAQEKAFAARFEALEAKLTEASLTRRIEEMLLSQLKKIGFTRGGNEVETPPPQKTRPHRGAGSPVKKGLFSTTTSSYP